LKASIKTISNITGFSQATVSNALNNKKGVNSKTAEIILKTAADQGYLSDPKISNIKLVIYKKSGEIVTDTPFFSELIEGIEDEGRKAGYETTVFKLSEYDDDFELLRKQLIESRNSGILLLATEMNKDDIIPFESSNSPIVILDSYIESCTFSSVLISNSDSVSRATDYLMHKGHNRIGYLAGNIRIQNFYFREMGLRRSLTSAGCSLNEKDIIYLSPTLDGSYNDMLLFLKTSPDLPPAFIADNDIIALGAMRALKDKGFRIPEDISIVGFDDMPYCKLSEPPLTTVHVDKRGMGRMAVRRLIDIVNSGDKVKTKTEICTDLIKRKSVSERKY
jgi:DNA-binding LacI/PurR family transcriptional regulator